MSSRAQSDVEALAHQSRALATFRQTATDAVSQADRAAAEMIGRIQTELNRRRAALTQAEGALRACLRSQEGSCDAEAAAVAVARRELEGAETALRIAERARAQFQAPKARYVRECSRLEGDGRRRLAAMSSDLETYLQHTSGGTDGGGFGPDGRGVIGGGAISQGLPTGWSMVPLSAIDDCDSGVTGAESFGKGYSPEDLAWAFGALDEVVLPAMARGKGVDYFEQRDQAEGRVGARSYTDTYRGFFGTDSAIKLDPTGDGRYTVGNGYHRIWVARRMGLSSVPGWIK